MKRIKKHIEIVASSQHELNSMSSKSREAIQATLLREYAYVDITIINNLSDLAALATRRPDMVFLGMKFVPSDHELGLSDPNKVWVSEYLDRKGIRYTGSDYLAIELELNKDLAKQCITDAGLRTPRFQVVRRDKQLTSDEIKLTYPLFVKPINRGGGVGVDVDSLAYNFQQLQAKVRSLSDKLQSDSLVEEYLPGREFSVGILKGVHTDQYFIMPIELVAPQDERGARYLSSQVKSMDVECHLEVTDRRLRAKINALAIDAFGALGARDYGRIDIRLDAMSVPHFLEANLLPSLLDNYGNFPKACLLNINLKHAPMILKIINLAFLHDIVTDVDVSEAGPMYNTDIIAGLSGAGI